ncbi:MAG: hypothetical protein EAZ57_05355 [Cytophagales bacterium]|nr:MAG: hypothetical protein EAZ67_06225 [Cytophagales bacterium]TAF60974.1 MAG: hypothetical protein EAZ57_05355 [Cytophagales bacterium]
MNTAKPLVVAIVGGESSGKTQLAKQLAAHYKTGWSPEFVRLYLDQKRDIDESNDLNIVEVGDIRSIVFGQTALEEALCLQPFELVFMDTCLIMTKLYTDYYLKENFSYVDKLLVTRQYDYFLLLQSDLEWEADDQRESPDVSQFFYETIRNYLINNHLPFTEIYGQGDARFHLAVQAVESWQKKF